MKMQLFHRIADSDSAAIRRAIVELGVKDDIDFRNVDTGETATADWRGHGGKIVPALWTGDELIQGRAPILTYLERLLQDPFPELTENFDDIVLDVWAGLKKIIPPEFNDIISQIHFMILDGPPADLVDDLDDELAEAPHEICGLHVGTPITKAMITTPDPMPVRVYLFRWALLDLIDPNDANPEAVLREEIAITLLHEIGHYFGLEEDDLDRLGYG